MMGEVEAICFIDSGRRGSIHSAIRGSESVLCWRTPLVAFGHIMYARVGISLTIRVVTFERQ